MHLNNGFIQLGLLTSSALGFFIPEKWPLTDGEELSNMEFPQSKRSPLFIPPMPADSGSNEEPTEILNRWHRRTTPSTKTSEENLASAVKRDSTNTGLSAGTPSPKSSAAAIIHDPTMNSNLVKMKFGSNQQELTMLIDTGAPYTWVADVDCVQSACLHSTRFNARASKTFVQLPDSNRNVSYGSGLITGSLAKDFVTIADLTVTATFIYAANVSDQFNTFPFDGILGLGKNSSENPNFFRFDTVMDSLVNSGTIKNKQFGMHLVRPSDSINNGEIIFGATDPALYGGDLVYHPVIAYDPVVSNNSAVINDPVAGLDDRWTLGVGDFQVGKSNFNFNGRIAVIDSGSSFLFMPQADIDIILTAFPGNRTAPSGSNIANMGYQYEVPCSTTGNIAVQFDKVRYQMQPSDYIGLLYPENGYCGLKIQSFSSFNSKIWLFGDVFLSTVYSVFDFDNDRIGLAQAGTTTVGPSITEIS